MLSPQVKNAERYVFVLRGTLAVFPADLDDNACMTARLCAQRHSLDTDRRLTWLRVAARVLRQIQKHMIRT